MTSAVTRKFSDLVIEDLNVAGMMRGHTPRAQADAGMGDLKRQMVYKDLWRHTRVILAPMWSQQQDLQRLRRRGTPT